MSCQTDRGLSLANSVPLGWPLCQDRSTDGALSITRGNTSGASADMIGNAALRLRAFIDGTARGPAPSATPPLVPTSDSISGAFLLFQTRVGSDFKMSLTPTPAPALDARLARCHRASAGSETHGTSTRDTSARLAEGRSPRCRQVGVGRGLGAGLSAAMRLEGLATLSLEHPRARAEELNRKQEAVLLAQSPAPSRVPRPRC